MDLNLQSTLAPELAAMLGVPCIFLDTLFWQPGWQQSSRDEFRKTVRAALDAAPDGWVVDGNFNSTLGSMVPDEATDIICE